MSERLRYGGQPAIRKRAATVRTSRVPLRCHLIVVKVASRCNLNCSYCYVYNAGDTSYLSQPAVMSLTTVDALIERATEHVAAHGLKAFGFAFHGGEPLLARPAYFRHFVERSRAALASTCVTYFMQTNGMLLTPEWCALLKQLDVRLGISLDGPKEINDRARVDHAGRGSYERARKGWELATSLGLDPGLLNVVDITASPLHVLQHLRELSPRMMDFLLPDATYEKPPPGKDFAVSATPYADWLLEIFHAWISDDSLQFPIRLFEQVINGLLGTARPLDGLGTANNELVVVESNGQIEPVDVLKICADGITLTPFNVHRNSLDDALTHPMMELYHHSNNRFCETCQRCLVRDVCGGGYLPHRYRRDNGFDNPSVYCADLMKLIIGIRDWLRTSLPEDLSRQLDFGAISYTDARDSLASVGR